MSGAGNGEGGLMGMIPFIAIIIIIYFFMIRPQAKKAKEQKEMISSLKKGDKIITIGGFYGTITEVKDSSFLVNLGKDTIVEISKDSVSTVQGKPEAKA
ncbi:MAG: preprotein translocase subunit YajC [Candidatus Cloacimonadota bacterium]|nr:MAG: preprotein translocase subunit YajC [Candidatus Cloacimonadota bacterium]PIE79302.1 MAG: preprotein translocase subunit YajC [Candidatus Delongbacteria bacterium]